MVSLSDKQTQFIWFLAPTVVLCSQQFEYLQSQISAVQIKFLSGSDGVDRCKFIVLPTRDVQVMKLYSLGLFWAHNMVSCFSKLLLYMLALLSFIGTEQSLWDAVLKNVKVVVSTYQILLDALTHGFVRMESLALIVFDEGDRSFTYHSSNNIQHMLTMGSPQLCFKTPRRDDNAELLP